MELPRAADVVLRSATFARPFLRSNHYLYPKHCRRRLHFSTPKNNTHRTSISSSPSRAISTSTAQNQQATAPKEEDDENQPTSEPSPPQQSSSNRTSSSIPQIPPRYTPDPSKPTPQPGRLRQELDFLQGARRPAPSPTSTPTQQRSRFTLEETLAQFRRDAEAAKTQNQNRPGAAKSKASADRAAEAERMQVSIQSMVDNLASPRSGSTADAMLWRPSASAQGQAAQRGVLRSTAFEADLEPAPFRIHSSLGRVVKVDAARNMDVARALRTVNIRAATLGIRGDTVRQKFHERGGLKRKRLRRERWRKRFKQMFGATVRRVEELKRMGW